MSHRSSLQNKNCQELMPIKIFRRIQEKHKMMPSVSVGLGK